MAGVKCVMLVAQLLLLLEISFISSISVAMPLPSKVAVEGLVYCKTCKLPGYNQGLDASALPGAVVQLQCNVVLSIGRNTFHVNLFSRKTTDQNGYFLIAASRRVSGIDGCKVVLVSSPVAYCETPIINSSNGTNGLTYEKNIVLQEGVYGLYTTDVLFFAPTNSSASCPNATSS